MQDMMTFVTWFIQEFPQFLMQEPIIYFIGIIILGFIMDLLLSLTKGRY